MKRLQIIHHVLDCGLSMVPVQCHKVKINQVLDTQQGYCEGNPLACRRVWKSCHPNRNNHTPESVHLHTTPLRLLTIWLVESSKARIWMHHHPVLVEFVDPGILFKEGRYPVYQMLLHTQIDSMKNIEYDNSHWWYACRIPDDSFWGSNHLILQIVSCFQSLRLISLSRKCDLLEV